MKTTIDHIPPQKQRQLSKALEILHEEFEDALKDATADFKKRGRILKIILFGSYAKATFVDEPFTSKGYRSDFDILVIVNNRKLTDLAEYWHKAEDRLIRDKEIELPVQFIVHSLREVNTSLKEGHHFFSDIRKEGIVLYELNDEPLAEPTQLEPSERLRMASIHFEKRFKVATNFALLSKQALRIDMMNEAAFLLHQSLEQAYSSVLLTLTNYAPASHNLKILRSFAEEQDRRLAEAFPREHHRERAAFNVINEAYVKARYSNHYKISTEALEWLGERTAVLLALVNVVCSDHVSALQQAADKTN
ncbi:nucleotidyltransferase and HEPN domain-containing protein [Agrobacterium rosae]|uniref:Nucleotidyltransferase n=1 Tax=Agrobacterium rosae TaxID=1972867 RepID=A0AAE5VMD6_9HYPH|nr:nucleotidyltransferase and HEPN domain-containing protein [Agrobacterium rosae]KAA3509096.1 HEPN domain-containing protein [Agrobacterium rosae]KAA3513792.1 HEPN domain-containing protein [Agrobacterium rosae]MCM2435735.1 HEPN domain-containing protein [Agrobacterium rosae]MDX8305802.1 nucleotidyltransferase and HEPN domain-containing protein [Agrobacterium rosae]MDX8332447.1 nucleotidyltransferase and HEPN domain-containing protein [Agrobacterium rosae]